MSRLQHCAFCASQAASRLCVSCCWPAVQQVCWFGSRLVEGLMAKSRHTPGTAPHALTATTGAEQQEGV